MTIPLIDKQDNFQIVDLQIAAILETEVTEQMILAAGAGKDPALWEFDTFLERMNPWEQFQDNKTPTPIVNVWYDTSNFNRKDGDVASQKDDVVYNIDVYAALPASDNVAGGHNPVDQSSVLELHRIIMLVRNILMHPDNTYLKLRGLVWQRWIQSKEIFQPQIGDRPVQGVIACRIPLSVSFNEEPVVENFPTVEVIGVEAKRAVDGKVILLADFDTI